MRTLLSRRAAVVAALLVAVSATAATAQRLFADVTGKWEVSMNMGQQSSTSVLNLKQSGDTLTGTIESQQLGTRELVGTVKGDTVRFGVTIDMQGNQFQLNIGGLVKDKDTMEGEFALPNGMGSFPFTAKRKP